MNSQLMIAVGVGAAVVALGILRRVRSRSTAGGTGSRGATAGKSLFSREVKVNRLWIMPTLFAVFCVGVLTIGPAPSLAALGVWVVALAIGGGLGWLRGKSMRIEVHPETAEVRSHAGGAFLGMIVVLVALRGGLRYWLIQNPNLLPIGASALTDAFLVMAVGVVAVQRLEMGLRARRLLAERTARLSSTFS